MRAAVLTALGRIEVQERPMPVLQSETDVLLRVRRVGVCGSDVHYYETGRIGPSAVHFPFIVGHECAAVVEALGPKVDRVKVGDRVAVDPAICCHGCDQCLAGRENTCRNLLFLGCPGQREGCLCEYIVMPQDCCYRLGTGVTLEHGVLSEPLAIAIHAVHLAGLGPGAEVAILGAGPIGLSCLVAARAAGAGRCFVTDLVPERMAAARTRGAAWAGHGTQEDVVARIRAVQPEGADAVFECAGRQETIDQATRLLRPGGRLLLVGIPRTDRVSLEIHTMRRQEIAVLNVRRQNRCTQKALEWIGQGRADVGFMATHVFPLDRCREAFELVAGYRDGVIKALIEI
ncbi:MAG: alcohol dehydrogenase catalytic domain-containing protein [Phycisphaerae bacterium]|nr:alcohol dehydrogenase catalytic domain-containing protein [Phycisphaerae bacterium]